MDRCIKAQDGWVCGVKIVVANMNYSALESNANCKYSVNINDFAELLGHSSEAMTRNTAKEVNENLTVQFKPCKPFALGKARSKNVSKILWNISSSLKNISC